MVLSKPSRKLRKQLRKQVLRFYMEASFSGLKTILIISTIHRTAYWSRNPLSCSIPKQPDFPAVMDDWLNLVLLRGINPDRFSIRLISSSIRIGNFPLSLSMFPISPRNRLTTENQLSRHWMISRNSSAIASLWHTMLPSTLISSMKLWRTMEGRNWRIRLLILFLYPVIFIQIGVAIVRRL